MKAIPPRLLPGFLGLLLLLTVKNAPAQSRTSSAPGTNQAVPAGKHTGEINALIYDGEERVLSAGADGFLGIWNIRNNSSEERFQLSSYSLISMVKRPGFSQIALIESDGMGLYRVSAWDYREKKNLFTLRFRDPVSFIAYSGGGNFLIVARSVRTGVVFLQPETGDVSPSPENLSVPVSFAATGRSERTMISYSPGGILSYWELESGEEIRHFTVSPNIRSPILFGNNRFFAGFDARGLVILDAVSGNEIFRDSRLPRGLLYQITPERTEFLCLVTTGQNPQVYRYELGSTGALELRDQRIVPPGAGSVTTATVAGSAAILGSPDGRLWSLPENGAANSLSYASQLAVREAGASGGTLSFITANNFTGFVPLNINAFIDGESLSLEYSGQYNHISAHLGDIRLPSGTFLFWQDEGTQDFPMIRQLPGNFRLVLDQVPWQFPLRSAVILGNQALLLDSVGNIRVVSTETGDLRFSFSSAGALDAAVLDEKNIVISRSAILGSTPFLKVDIETGETVSLAYPAAIGARIYRGESGSLYGAALTSEAGNVQTSIIRLNTYVPAYSARLVEYQGEDTGFGIAESGGALASTIGGDGATLYGSLGFVPFERSPGLPLRILNGGEWFIAIDTEGNICWHENQSGKLLALLRLYPDEWVLELNDGTRKRGRLRYR